jgi:hypothetical protein
MDGWITDHKKGKRRRRKAMVHGPRWTSRCHSEKGRKGRRWRGVAFRCLSVSRRFAPHKKKGEAAWQKEEEEDCLQHNLQKSRRKEGKATHYTHL